MNPTVITCAITGNLTKPEQTPHLPITPEQIANSALEAARAGAAQVHIHVRDPQTGRPSMDVALYDEVIRRIRAENREVIINLTTGPGGRYVPSEAEPRVAGPGTTLLPPEKRVEHIARLRPDVCSLDLNTMNSGAEVVINTPRNVRIMAGVIREAGVKPELEIFDSGDIHLARDLIADGTLDGPGMWTFVTGVKYGFEATPETLLYARGLLPAGAFWSAFGVGRHEFPMLAAAFVSGGHVRVGLEDNIYLSRGVLAPSNAALVERAARIVQDLGGSVASAGEARDMLGLPIRN
ncbi:3-keto-5-aminohexanoate cleavage protein [Pigmentiphaga sp. GD03639]|uniref:3-keto-5-aminohexanoate cleavage protein n=1 Tax=unclassified Pigmentiphaga TaxID=2626614 RepID=UPI00244A23A2|nr:3-keto-5-aminohexanoate cleavage protein [Pigmentiphaga sp. GD03639]MDH2235524.1 3-keto-5-aminohexanoate cleavage protein [Pigmentiphaga sp. GD03639]